MKRFIVHHIHFTRLERLGSLVLLGICLLGYISPWFFSRLVHPSPPDFSALDALAPQLPKAAVARETPPPPPSTASRLFFFDPNTANRADLTALGLDSRTVQSILNYRSKGGIFRKPADFAKMYTLAPADFERLQPYIQIAAPMEADAPTLYAEAPRPVQYAGFAFPEYKKKADRVVNINTAGEEEWRSLPGIGEKRARQILQFRQSLGGFVSVEQVAETYQMPDSVFQKIRPLLRPDPGAMEKIDLNSASEEELERHPYISGKQARLIAAYRQQHGPFSGPADLLNIVVFQKEQAWVEKIAPYLRFGPISGVQD
jgi:competence protein ComEA